MTTATQTLADFLLARLDEDEQIATAAGHGCGYLHEHNGGWVEVELPEAHNARPVYEMRFIKQFDPARVLAECAAKRAIVGLHEAYGTPQVMVYGTITACSECGSVDDSPVEWPCPTLRAIASVYASHPDFDPAWR